MRKRRRNNLRRTIFSSFIILLLLTIGYSVLETQLNIGGISQLSSSFLNVRWENIKVTSGSVSATTSAHVLNGQTIVEFAPNFNNAGDYYEFSVDATNYSNYNIMINFPVLKLIGEEDGNPIEIDLMEDTNTFDAFQQLFTITTTYDDGVESIIKDLLKPGTNNKEKIIIRIEAKVDTGPMPYTIQMGINYVKADNTGKQRKHYINNPCEFNGQMVQGAEYVNGQYTYRYKQEANLLFYNLWQNIDDDGWGVALTDINSTDPVNTPICSTINGKPIVSMQCMYRDSQASSIDLTTINTSKVTNMNSMFYGIQATSLDLSNIDTSNVTQMMAMFATSKVRTLDLSTFETDNVQNMIMMFSEMPNITSLNLSMFDTSNVIAFDSMFAGSRVLTSINLSSFSTSNVTDMTGMFSNMTSIEEIDISSFDTSNVTDMSAMFLDCPNLETIYVGLGGSTENVTSSVDMFLNDVKLPNFDPNYVDKTYAHTGPGGYLTLKT